MKAFDTFSVSGGRLLKLALIVTIVGVIVIAVQATYIKMAMNQVYALATMTVEEGEAPIVIPAFYNTLITYLDPGGVIASLVIVYVAIAARYGIREGTKNMADGSKYRAEMKAGEGTIHTSEEISK